MKRLRFPLLLTLSVLLTPAQAENAMPEPVSVVAPEPLSETTPDITPSVPGTVSEPLPDPLGPPAATIVAPATPAEPSVLPGREGYAFGKPEILVRQRLFGLVHGVSLLAATCLDMPEQSVSIQNAYAAWHEHHAQAIETIVHDLANYYFGSQAAAAQWPDLVRALKLKETLDAALGQFELSAACTTLPQAMEGPRYDLTALLQDDPMVAMATISGIPLPTSGTGAGSTTAAVPAPAPVN